MGAVIRSNKMRSISIVCVLSTAACLVLGSVIPVANEGAQPKKVICTFPDWAGYRPGIGKFVPANIEPERCTHIVYAFAKLDETTNTIAVADNWADIGEHFYQQVVGLKYDRYVNRKILLSIGGYNDSKGYKYSVMIADSKTRNIFVDSVVAFLKKYGFDGLNFDWEYPGCPQNTCNQPDDKENFVKLVEELGTALHGEGLLLSVATSANPHTIEYGLDLTGLAPHIDWFTVMTLDYHGSWDRYTAHASPLYDYPGSGNYAYNLNYTVHYFLDHGVDKTKIVVDIPFYGHSYTLSDPTQHGVAAATTGQGGNPGLYTRVRGTLAYYEICKMVQEDHWTVVQDPEKRTGPYAYSGNQWVSYDDVASVGRKAQYILDNDLAGAMVWDVSNDDFQVSCKDSKFKNPLVTEISTKLMGEG